MDKLIIHDDTYPRDIKIGAGAILEPIDMWFPDSYYKKKSKKSKDMTAEDKAKMIYNEYYMLFFEYEFEEILISILSKKASLLAIDLIIKHDGSSKYLINVKDCLNKY